MMLTVKGSLVKFVHRRAAEIAELLFFCFSLRRRKAKRLNPSGNRIVVLAPYDQRIDAFFVYAAKAAQDFSIAGIPVPLKSGINGNGKTIILCVLCDSSEAGGEYKLTYLHSKLDPKLG